MKGISLQDLAAKVGGTVQGDGSFMIKGIASLTDAGPTDIAFLGDARRGKELADTKAGALILPPEVEDSGVPTLVSSNPYLAFVQAITLFNPPPAVTEHRIHPTAVIGENVSIEEPVEIGPGVVIEAGVSIGAGTIIEPHCVIGKATQIGPQCRLHARTTLYHNLEIGARVEIHSGAIIGADGFGYARDGAKYVKFPQLGRVVLEDDVEVGAGTTIDRGAIGDTIIKRGVKIDNLCQIAHNVIIGEDTAMAAQVGVSGSTKIGARCMVGGQSGFAGHSTIGDEVQIGAKSGMRGNVADQTSWFGAPAMPMGEALRNIRAFAHLHDWVKRIRKLEKAAKSE